MHKIIMILILGLSSIANAGSFEENILACENDNAQACYDAGVMYSAEAYKEEGYKQSDAASKVAAFYRESCRLGYAVGCTAYGMSYAADKKKDIEKDAQYFFQKGCDGGDEAGCNLMKLAPKGR